MQNTQAINVKAGSAVATGSVTVSDSMPGVPCPDPAGYKYIGARYVPMFSEPMEWNINSTYEPLTIVLHNGNSYTSKQFVPTGVQIDNTEYWANTGNYNAQVEQYRQQVVNLQNDVDELVNEVYFASPENYGAKGDGVTNDIAAIVECINNNNNILFKGNYKIESPIYINANNKNLYFAKGGVITCPAGVSAFVIGNSSTVENLTIENARLQGSGSGIAFDVYKMGFHSSIIRPYINGFQYGLKTEQFDAMQLTELNEPYIGGCEIAINDAAGGLQDVRIIGGRIEQNEAGILTATPNSLFIGTIIEGNTKYEVKFTNTTSSVYPPERAYSSKGFFVSCYFEHFDGEDNEGSIVCGADASSGWWGEINIVNCISYIHGSEAFININGNAISGGQSAKVINITNLSGDYKKLIDGPNIGVDSLITINGVTNSAYTSSVLGGAQVTKASGQASKLIQLSLNSLSSGTMQSEVVQIGPPATYRQFNINSTEPWKGTSGTLKGGLAFNTVNSRWYQRIALKGDGDDAQTNWAALPLMRMGTTDPSGAVDQGFSFYLNTSNGELWFCAFSKWTKLTTA